MVSDGAANQSTNTSQQEREKTAGPGAGQMDVEKVQVEQKRKEVEDRLSVQSVVAKVAELYAVPASPEVMSAPTSARSPLVEEADVEFLAVRACL